LIKEFENKSGIARFKHAKDQAISFNHVHGDDLLSPRLLDSGLCGSIIDE
jgi:hypothetical protein